MIYIIFLAILSLFMAPFFEIVPRFLQHTSRRKYTKRNKCTGCVNIEYCRRGRWEHFSLFFFYRNNEINLSNNS